MFQPCLVKKKFFLFRDLLRFHRVCLFIGAWCYFVCAGLSVLLGFALAFVGFHMFEIWLEKRVGHGDSDSILSMVHDVESGISADRKFKDSVSSSQVDRDDKLAHKDSDGLLRRRRGPDSQSNGPLDGHTNSGSVSQTHEEKQSKPFKQAQAIKSWNRTVLLISAITVHNFPEGMAVGVAFGAASRCVCSCCAKKICFKNVRLVSRTN